MLSNIKYTIVLLLALMSFSAFALDKQEAQQLFEEANKKYTEQAYKVADSLYTKLEKEGFYSPELYYNMGNVNYKLRNIPKTIYYYEKALKLSPGNEDIIHNLKLANQLLADKNTIKTSTRIDDLLYSFIHSSTNFWALMALSFALVGGMLLVVFVVTRNNRLRKITFYIGVASFLLATTFTYFASLEYNKQTHYEYGIIYSPYVELKTEPSDKASSAFILHEGTKVKVLNENEHWYEVSFGDGQVAWLKKEDLRVF